MTELLWLFAGGAVVPVLFFVDEGAYVFPANPVAGP